MTREEAKRAVMKLISAVVEYEYAGPDELTAAHSDLNEQMRAVINALCAEDERRDRLIRLQARMLEEGD